MNQLKTISLVIRDAHLAAEHNQAAIEKLDPVAASRLSISSDFANPVAARKQTDIRKLRTAWKNHRIKYVPYPRVAIARSMIERPNVIV